MRVGRDVGLVMQAGKLGVTAFLMIANTERFWIDVPKRNRTYESPVSTGLPKFGPDKAFLNLRPNQIIEALCPSPAEPERDGFRWLVETGRMSYVLTLFKDPSGPGEPGVIRRRISMDPETLTLRRIEIFDEAGAIESEITYASNASYRGNLFPTLMTLERPRDAVSLVMKLDKVVPVNPANMERPHFNVPSSRDRIHLDRDKLTEEDYTNTLD
ncbi:hypothetical protein ACFLU6_03605 [Acidobacteriota bacterium]